MLLNDDIVDIEYGIYNLEYRTSAGIRSPTLDVDELSGLFLHPSIFSIKRSRSS